VTIHRQFLLTAIKVSNYHMCITNYLSNYHLLLLIYILFALLLHYS